MDRTTFLGKDNMNNRNLIIFTSTFPYGFAEPFLEEELPYLAKHFEKIIIFPFRISEKKLRAVPPNCVVSKPIVYGRFDQYLKGLFNARAFCVFIRDFFSKKVYANKLRLKTWIIAYIQTAALLNSKAVRQLFDEICETDVCYFYWGKGALNLSYFYKGKAKYVARFHGEWDLWEESSGNYAPIRQKISESLDLAAFISKKGEAYFHSKYANCPTGFYPLGTNDIGVMPDTKDDAILNIVSCSTVYPLKRVPLIFQALNNMQNVKIHWTHLGGGSHFDELKKLVEKERKEHLSVDLLGMFTHDQVMDWYKNNHADLFINMSTNEGVPVSIMEAASFNIPILATNVGGTSEIVQPQVGELLSSNPEIDEICSLIKKMRETHYEPREFWKMHYSASTNYNSFALKLKTL